MRRGDKLYDFRYRGLAKNATRAFTALALSNICMSRERLMVQVRP
jgi:IS5 family transposase